MYPILRPIEHQPRKLSEQEWRELSENAGPILMMLRLSVSNQLHAIPLVDILSGMVAELNAFDYRFAGEMAGDVLDAAVKQKVMEKEYILPPL
jgi:hypothetical protein